MHVHVKDLRIVSSSGCYLLLSHVAKKQQESRLRFSHNEHFEWENYCIVLFKTHLSEFIKINGMIFLNSTTSTSTRKNMESFVSKIYVYFQTC